jgi:hypothetical protein
MKHPKSIGTSWKGARYVHGPRQRPPSRFSRLYTLSVAQAKKRLHKLPNKPTDAAKVIAGTLKTRKFAVQSYLTPVRRSKLIRSTKGSIFMRKKHLRRKPKC